MAQTVSELARRLNRRHARCGNFPPLLLMTDAKRLPDPHRIIPRLPQGSAIIVRHFSRIEKWKIICNIKNLCRKHKVKIYVSDDQKLAISERLDGLHLSEKQLRNIAACGQVIKPYPGFQITAACHSITALRMAEKARIDAVLISPAFTTQSHPNIRTKGVIGLQMLATSTSLKCYGLGGLQTKTARHLIHTELCGFAGISGLV